MPSPPSTLGAVLSSSQKEEGGVVRCVCTLHPRQSEHFYHRVRREVGVGRCVSLPTLDTRCSLIIESEGGREG